MNQHRKGLYLHIPFCSKRCGYCDFFSLETRDMGLIKEYSRKVIGTVLERTDEFGDFSTVYIGGGSPSMLPVDFFREFNEKVLRLKQFENVEEFTVEINPADINEPWLEALSENGVNRVSTGVQSMNSRVLNEMGRRTRVCDIEKNLPVISKYFKNISADFIYGLGKNRKLKTEVQDIFELSDINHISIYEYTRPEKKNAPDLISDDETLKQELEIREILKEKGFERYEISNFSKKGKRSLHNMIYWSYGSWLGVGAGAHSFNCETGEHSFYQHDVGEFINGGGLSRFTPSQKELVEEFFLMGLRTIDGVDLNKFKMLFGRSLENEFSFEVIEKLEKDGFIKIDNDRIRCTEKGFDFLNSVLLKIFESYQNDR